MSERQYLVRTHDGLDYARVEPWQGGLEAAKGGAKAIGGYVVALTDWLVPVRPEEIIADFRPVDDSPESYATDGYGPHAADAPRVGE